MKSSDLRINQHGHFASVLEIHAMVLEYVAFRLYFHSTGFIRILCERFRRDNSQSPSVSQVPLHARVTKAVLEIIGSATYGHSCDYCHSHTISFITEKVPECLAVLVREQRVLELIVRGLLTLSNPSFDRINREWPTSSSPMSILTDIFTHSIVRAGNMRLL